MSRLQRFLDAQDHAFEPALAEVRAGRKTGHWMWFMFPQLQGLGESDYSAMFSLSGLEEARAFLDHGELGPRLREMAEEFLTAGKPAVEVFPWPDHLKLVSCLTLFEQVAGKGSVFQRVLDSGLVGPRDQKTLELLEPIGIPEYEAVRFRTEADWTEVPVSFGIVTAYATTGEVWTEAENQAADAALKAILVDRAVLPRRITGFSPETGHAEPGWAVATG